MNSMHVWLMLTCVAVAGVIVSCKKDKDNTTNNNTEVLTEANNNKALGKYSGILIGSSGYYSIELRNSGSKATVIFDGKTYTLDGQGAIEDDKAITNYTLQKDDIKITFSVGADGKNPGVKISIPGHTVYATVSKETTVFETIRFVGRIRDSVNKKDLNPAALTISNNIITGYAKLDTQTISISGQRVDTTSKLNIVLSTQPSKTHAATISGNTIGGGTQYIFYLSKVN